MLRILAFALMLSAGCADESPPSEIPPACAAPSRMVGERCLEAGVQDDGCPAGTVGIEGGCRSAGVPPDRCGTGFVHDGDVGCQAVLPAESCPPGFIAVPGDRSCRPLMDCGSGPWGNIAHDDATEFVDASFTGVSDGSMAAPWTSIIDAVAAVPPGGLVAIAAGSYVGDVTVSGKAVRLHGVCPTNVEIVGVDFGAVVIREGASGSELTGVALRGTESGALVSGAENVVLDSLWVQGCLARGIDIEGTLGPTSGTIVNTLVEDSADSGVYLSGVEAAVEATVVRGTRVDAAGNRGQGIAVQQSNLGVAAVASVRGSLVEANTSEGIFVFGATADIETTVVRHTQPTPQQVFGRGIAFEPAGDVLAQGSVKSSLLSGNHDVGLLVGNAAVTVDATVVRDTLCGNDACIGRGASIQGAGAQARITDSVFDGNRAEGVFVRGAGADIDAVVVRRTLLYPQSERGDGIALTHDDELGLPATMTLRRSVIEQSTGVGVNIGGANARIEGTLVRDTWPDGSGDVGRGVNVQLSPERAVASMVELSHSVVERSFEVGVLVDDSVLDVSSSRVSATAARGDGKFGDGIIGASDHQPATLTIEASLVEESARAGIGNFGAFVSLGRTAVRCANFELQGEVWYGHDFRFEDRGQNACGCPVADGACEATSPGLGPPVALE